VPPLLRPGPVQNPKRGRSRVHPDFRFCGLKTDAGVPYCAYHCRIAYQPAGERRREREQERRTQRIG
jgi:hypothetical protein